MSLRDLGAARLHPLAGILGSLFAVSTAQPAFAANTLQVQNCNDAGPNSLRDLLGTAMSGDTLDLSLLTCTITLNTAQLAVTQDSLTIKGSGASNLIIDASQIAAFYDRRAFVHSGGGTLTLQDMKVTGGRSYHTSPGFNAFGGCVYSEANLTLYRTIVSGCSAESIAADARGGGVYAAGTLRINLSALYGNSATSGDFAWGGAARSGDTMFVKYSTIDGNHVSAAVSDAETSFKYARGGGLSSAGTVNVLYSTISRNTSNGSFGGIDATSSLINTDIHSLFLANSTVSGNHADKLVGGVYTNNGAVTVYNSTIAFNSAGVGHTGTGPSFEAFAAGMTLSAISTDVTAKLQSSLWSNNVYGTSAENDFGTAQDAGVFDVTFDAASANNFIRADTSKNALPAGTLGGASCPWLGELRDNGGLTQTHSLRSHSVAIDAGNNVAGADEDQRHLKGQIAPFPHPRALHGAADIGAYEVDQDEVVFDASFEGCPALE